MENMGKQAEIYQTTLWAGVAPGSHYAHASSRPICVCASAARRGYENRIRKVAFAINFIYPGTTPCAQKAPTRIHPPITQKVGCV